MVGDSSGMWKGTEGLSEKDKEKAKSYYSNQKGVWKLILAISFWRQKVEAKFMFKVIFSTKKISF